MSERTVYFDMDNTGFDFDSAALANIAENLRLPRKEFYIAKDYPEEQAKTIEDTYNAVGFFESLKPYPGFLKTWGLMLDNGIHPNILSAPLTSNPTSVEGKIYSLTEHLVPEFGPSVVEEAIFDKQKWRHSGIVIFDDRPDLPRGEDGRDDADWEHVLYGWKHMLVVPLARTSFRQLDWSDPQAAVDLVLRIEEQKNLV